MCEQERTGVMLKLVHLREAMLVQNNCTSGLQFERSIFARCTVYKIQHCFSYVSHVIINICGLQLQ